MKVALFLANAGKNSGGPEIYDVELMRALARIDQRNEYHAFFLFPGGPAAVGPRPDNVFYHVLQPSSAVVSLAASLPLALSRLQPDAVHSTFVPPALIPPRMAYTLPCTAPFECPQYYPRLIRLRLQALCGLGVHKSQMVMCISEHVREWARRATKLSEDRLPLVPLAANRLFRPMTEADRRPIVKEKYGLDSPYFLFSGRWEERKNLLRLLVAFAQFKRHHKTDYKLALTGQRTWAAREADHLIRQLRIERDVVDLGKSPVSDLPALYSGAAALMYPSLWESFGLPIVEAMSCGTPIVTSKLAAMPETAGKAALLVDPLNIQDMAEAMERLSRDEHLRAELGNEGLKRSREFSWEETARKSLHVYEMLASRN